jgi:ApaG protein
MNSKNQKFSALVSTETGFVERQSDAKNRRFVFAYTITIENTCSYTIQLVSRHWLIKDANNKIEEVFGEGVVGEQPIIQPGQQYTYSSGAVLETEMGTMEGRYFMRSLDGDDFKVVIPKFVLTVPRTLH